MALPYVKPRTTWDVTKYLDQEDVRTYDSSLYSGKHVRVIPKTTIDTGRGLLFNNCASVTIIGPGYFRPSARPQYAAGNGADGSFVFFQCGPVYLEGIILDNINSTGKNNTGTIDGIQLVAKTKLTPLTLQNCRIVNVKGQDDQSTGLHGDIIQAGSNTQGKAGPIRIYNFTGSGNYQGFFWDPQEGITSVDLTNVNLSKTETNPEKTYFWYSSAARYTNNGYPIKLKNVWGKPSSGQILQRDNVWPSSGATTHANFMNSKYAAVRATDPVTGRVGCYWPGLQDTGKKLEGYIYEGAPATDFVPVDKIWPNYTEGTDINDAAPPPPPDPVVIPDPLYENKPRTVSPPFVANSSEVHFQVQRGVAGEAIIKGINLTPWPLERWISGGPGAVTATVAASVSLTGAGGTVPTFTRRAFETVPGAKFTLFYEVGGNPVSIRLGSLPNGSDVAAAREVAVGTGSLEFTAKSTVTHLLIERTATGTATVSSISISQGSGIVWSKGGPGTSTISADNNTITLNGVGGTPTYVRRTYPTIAGREYTLKFKSTSTTGTAAVGSTAGGGDLVAAGPSFAADTVISFKAVGATTHLQLQRTSVGAVTLSGFSLTVVPISAVTWVVGGPTPSFAVINSDGSVSLTGSGNSASPTYGRLTFPTTVGQNYTLSFDVATIGVGVIVGTAAGQSQIMPLFTGNVGSNSVVFKATTATTHVQFQRVGADTTTRVSNVNCKLGGAVVTPPPASGTVPAIVASFNDDNLGGIGKRYLFIDRVSDSASDGSFVNGRGSGSLRWCLAQGSNSLILNEVQGVIKRTANLDINAGRSYISIIGYTGPGPLIIQGSWQFGIRGHHHVIEHLAFERQYDIRGVPNGDGMQLISDGSIGEARFIRIAGCTTAYTQDEALQIFRNEGSALTVNRMEDISVHWNVFTNPLRSPNEFDPDHYNNGNWNAEGVYVQHAKNHAFNTLIGGKVPRVDYQNNLSCNGSWRNPRNKGPAVNRLMANSIVANWSAGGITFESDVVTPFEISVIGCIGISGPDTGHPHFISQWGKNAIASTSEIYLEGNSVIKGPGSKITPLATLGSQTAASAPPTGWKQSTSRVDTLLAVKAIAQAELLRQMELNAGPFPKIRAANPDYLKSVTQAINVMKRTVEGKLIDDHSQGPGLSNPPFRHVPLTGNNAPPTDHTNVQQVKDWLHTRKMLVAYA